MKWKEAEKAPVTKVTGPGTICLVNDVTTTATTTTVQQPHNNQSIVK